MEKKINLGLNTIFFGPPGTGKTYNTVIAAVAIIEGKDFNELRSEIDTKKKYEELLEKYRKYKSDGRIAFSTFHQSYGYEEFIEGIKPTIDEKGNINYEVAPGHFKKFCSYAQLPIKYCDEEETRKRRVWKVNRKCLGCKNLKEPKYIDISILNIMDKGSKNAFDSELQPGDFVLVNSSDKVIEAIGILQEKRKTDNNEDIYIVKWLIENLQENIYTENDNTYITPGIAIYELERISLEYIYEILLKHKYKEKIDKPFVFIIDEINRGNISKIFGELITLVEDSKRLGKSEEMTVKLPYSGKEFGIPNNVYIIGTMNTADRSIALMDTALRRRFNFEEMMPKPKLLKDVKVKDENQKIEIDIQQLLEDMNEKIEFLYDREHMIGHAYFMPLIESPTMKTLADIFKNKIIPLLQEYFYDDYAKIRLVLGDNKASDEKLQFIKAEFKEINDLFGDTKSEELELDKSNVYIINEEAFNNIKAYKHILKPVNENKAFRDYEPKDDNSGGTPTNNEKAGEIGNPETNEGAES